MEKSIKTNVQHYNENKNINQMIFKHKFWPILVKKMNCQWVRIECSNSRTKKVNFLILFAYKFNKRKEMTFSISWIIKIFSFDWSLSLKGTDSSYFTRSWLRNFNLFILMSMKSMDTNGNKWILSLFWSILCKGFLSHC